MSGAVVRFRNKKQRLDVAKAAELRQSVVEAGLPPDMESAVVGELDRRAASQNGWSFVMLSPDQNAAVVAWLIDNSKRPLKAVRLWSELFRVLRNDTGEILRSRDELAVAIGESPSNVSTLMGELEKFGAVIRRREPVPGVRGPGRVRWYMNPTIGTHLAGVARDKAQATAPTLRLVGGGV